MAKTHHDPISALEWGAAAFGLVVAVLLLAIIGREAFVGREDAVPILSVQAQRVVQTPSGHIVEFVVQNSSSQTAAAVHVEGTIKGSTAEEETSSTTVDYVPGRSSAKGGILFTSDPRAGGLELRVTGYEIP